MYFKLDSRALYKLILLLLKQLETDFQMSCVRKSMVNMAKDITPLDNTATEFQNPLTCAQNCACHFSLILRGPIQQIVFGK